MGLYIFTKPHEIKMFSFHIGYAFGVLSCLGLGLTHFPCLALDVVNIGCKPHAKVTWQVLWDDTLDLGYGKLIMSDTFLTLSNAIMVILGLDDKFLYQNLGHILKHFTSRSKWPQKKNVKKQLIP